MARCTRKDGLEVHHVRKDGGNGLSNAEVLCRQCHEATPSYGAPVDSPLPFDQYTKERVLALAGRQCECMRTGGCH